MIRIRGPTESCRIDDLAIRQLAEQRFAEVCNDEPYDPEIHGEMIFVEPGDTLASLEEHSHCYEMMFLFSDDGAGINFFVPKQGTDAELLELCARFAVRAPELAQS